MRRWSTVAYAPRASGRADTVTPELALVDPRLAERLRFELSEGDDTLARVEDLLQVSRIASLARRSNETNARARERPASEHRGGRIGRWRRPIVAGSVGGVLALGVLIGVRVDLRGTSAGADTQAIAIPPVSDPATGGSGRKNPRRNSVSPPDRSERETPRRSRVRPPNGPNGPAAQRFAWAPAPGASAYHVELFRGSSKVFEVETKHSSMTIPAHWQFEQRSRALEPGEYRWYVWPVNAGRRAAQAIVQAKLVIPSR